MPRAKNGAVSITARNDMLRLRWRVGGKPYQLALGLRDNPTNRRMATIKASVIEQDLLTGNFDATLAKYRHSEQEPITLNLVDLWQRYTTMRRNIVAETTIKIQYQAVASHIRRLPSTLQNPEQAKAIRDHLLGALTLDTTIRTLTQLSACCEWASDTGLIESNPFRGLAKKLRRSTKSKPKQDIDPFDKAETDAIIQAFEHDPVYSHYAPYVKFLFWTGCRTGEAIALCWHHVSPDCSEILFSESVSTQLKIRKETKTHKTRHFPCNGQLQQLLLTLKSDSSTLVFASREGGEINARHFIQNAWKGRQIPGTTKFREGIVTRLVREGQVKRYRTQYNTRHTFITRALEQGVSIAQVAKWVGNSPETITKHYMGIISKVSVPEM